MGTKQMVNIGERIKNLREASFMMQKDLAKAVNVSIASLSAYEKNKSEPSLETASKIANVFGVSLDYLINGISVDKTIENKTGLSSNAITWLVTMYKTNIDITDTINLLFESKAFHKAIDELNIARLIEIGSDDSDLYRDALISSLNEIHNNAGLDPDKLQITKRDKEELHLHRSTKYFECAIDGILKEVWNNGTR